MALDFPANPTSGDTYTSGNIVWVFDGTAWNIQDPGASSVSFGTIVADGTSITASVAADTVNLVSGDNVSLSTSGNSITVASSGNLLVAADDAVQRSIPNTSVFRIIGGTGISTTSATNGNITITADTASTSFSGLGDVQTASLTIDQIYTSAITTFRIDNVGVTAYTFEPHYTGNNPTIYAISGTTVAFDLNGIPSLPFEIQDNTLSAITSNLTHIDTDGTISTDSNAQGKSSGTLYWTIPENEAGTYVYQCQTEVAMFGTISVKRLSTL